MWRVEDSEAVGAAYEDVMMEGALTAMKSAADDARRTLEAMVDASMNPSGRIPGLRSTLDVRLGKLRDQMRADLDLRGS